MTSEMKKLTFTIFFVVLLAIPFDAHAYIGPGAGFAFLGSTAVFLVTILMAFATLLFWPLQWLWRKLRGFGIPRRAKARRVIVVGLDGLEPKLVNEYMQKGFLPNMQAIKEQGTYTTLGTTLPALSPVAWSSFQTGVNPGAHNIFDFLTRDKRFCLPLLSSVDTEEAKNSGLLGKLPFFKAKSKIKLLRKSQPFWKLLGKRGIFCNILRVPISYPPEPCFGNVLSAMCTPDIRGTQGTFSFYTTDSSLSSDLKGSKDSEGGEVHTVKRNGNTIEGFLIGPPNPNNGGSPMQCPFKLEVSPDKTSAVLIVGKHKETLELNKYSSWVVAEFKAGRKNSIQGICRFCLRQLEPELKLYVSPINVDPKKPALPIASPIFYSGYLSRKIGSFGTLGLMEDTWGRNEHAIDDSLFVQQTYLTHAEREKMLFDALDRTPEGLCVCVFDASDRLQHMFWRYLDAKHPSPKESSQDFTQVIPEMYKKMDVLVGKVREKLKPNDVLIIMSDHGFTSFRRCVNINSWLEKEGYLTLIDGKRDGDYLRNVDWSKTKAFGLGLAGIYINRAGREYQGIVEDSEVEKLKKELTQKLQALKDPQDNHQAIRKVYDTSVEYQGLYADEAPDLIVGYEPGYRVSWDSVKGAFEDQVFSDNLKAWSGDHHVDPLCVPGILFINRKNVNENANIVDIAPTILDLFSVPVPAYMEGKPLF